MKKNLGPTCFFNNRAWIFLIATALMARCTPSPYSGPLSPEEALKSFHIQEGFAIDLFAAEPNVLDPVEMAFDEQGNIYAVEMPDYPYRPEPGKEVGRIKLLKDTDGDGTIDASIVFADKLREATSILPWEKGLLVASAPYILFLKDTNNDFKADIREIVFKGFFDNNSEAQITNLRFGVDNWIYASNNGQVGEVTYMRNPNAPPLSTKGGDFRFRLDRGLFELEAGAAQFGQAFDDWGHRFITQNTLHIRHVVIPWRYNHRHPYLPSTNAVLNVSDHDLEMFQETPPPYWRAERTRRRQLQYAEEKLDRVEYAEDHFTGASGGTAYSGDVFPKEYQDNIFTGDVAGNLIHRDILVPLFDAPSFVAQRGDLEKDREFLSSTDPWFRPDNFTVGPDGMLYVMDMYRQHIETPLSIPEDLKADMDFYNGSQLGRIYRIRPENMAIKKTEPLNLREKGPKAWVALLAHPNRWWRLQAQRLILEHKDMSIVPLLKDMFTTHDDERARLHALYSLEGLNALDAELVTKAMKDLHPGVREHGAMLSERYPECLPILKTLTNDVSARVAFQALLSLGEFPKEETLPALAQGLVQHRDPWFQTAVLSSQAGSTLALLEYLVQQKKYFVPGDSSTFEFMEAFAHIVGARHEQGEIARLLDLMSGPVLGQPGLQLSGLNGLAKGLEKSKIKGLDEPLALKGLDTIGGKGDEGIQKAVEAVKQALSPK